MSFAPGRDATRDDQRVDRVLQGPIMAVRNERQPALARNLATRFGTDDLDAVRGTALAKNAIYTCEHFQRANEIEFLDRWYREQDNRPSSLSQCVPKRSGTLHEIFGVTLEMSGVWSRR